MFLGVTFVAVMAGLPLVVSSQTEQPAKPAAPAAPPAAKPSAQLPTDFANFEQADRNKDGQVDKSEAGVVPGLSANFERADRNKDGKLDQAEFAKGLQILQVRR
jgi:EF hand